MPGCAAVGCNNRSEKGYRMKCFPRDPILRKIWQTRVARANWEPSNNSFLCHEHFESDKWCTMENGRVKLKKNAIPSIFTVISTRKSIKKSTRRIDDNKNNCEIGLNVMHVKNDRKHSSIDLEEEYSVSQDIDHSSIQFARQQMNNFSKSIEGKQSSPVQDYDLQQENILISDNSIKKEEAIEVYDVKEQKDENNEKNEKPVSDFALKLADNFNEDLIKPELKEAQTSFRSYIYDEIEEKLKIICDGYGNSNNMEKPPISDNPKEVLQQTSNKTPVHRSINYRHSSGNNIGHMLANDTEDIEIIFCAEDREEDTHVPKCASHNSNMIDETEMLDLHTTSINSVNNNKETEQNINVTPNMVAAMKRKWRTRDEIMKSIEKSICKVSSQDANSLSDSDISDDIGKKKDRRKKIQKMQDESSSDTSMATTRFTVKVTGHPDDISDIIHDLSRSSGDTNHQKHNDVCSPKEDDGFITSVITIDDCSVDMDVKTEFQDNSFSSSSIGDIASNNRMLPSTSKNCPFLKTEVTLHSEEEEDFSNLSIIQDNTSSSTNDCVFTDKYEELQQKLSMQTDIVKELGSQLILCKRVEHELQNKNSTLEKEIKSMTDELYALSNDVASSTKANAQQKLINDLTSKLNRFEETNQKLVRSATTGIEQVKSLQSQLKQKDNQIKELKWKLDKASKYLERAEKNTNTYRRKMLNMQSFLKKKKFMDETVIQLNEILMDAIKKSYTSKILPMNIAMKIKKTCGTAEYDRLLQSGFPLPVRVVSDNLPDSKENNKVLRTTVSEPKAKKMKKIDNTQNTKNVKLETENTSGKITVNDTETVMGTVQDIFDESNDDDDFSMNELAEDFISQLDKFM